MCLRRCKQPKRCNRFRLLIYLNLFYMFRATTRLSSGKLLTLYTAFGTMHRYCWRPVTLSPVDRWRCASLSSEVCRADSNRSINWSINGICRILLVAYIIVLMTIGLKNVKLMCIFADDSLSFLRSFCAPINFNVILFLVTFVRCILILSKFYLFTNWCTSELS